MQTQIKTTLDSAHQSTTPVGDYRIWRRSHVSPGDWLSTAWTVRARSDNEAQSKMRRMFARAGFHSMALVAVRFGDSPSSDGSK